MTFRDFPAGNVYNDPSIDYFEMPDYIADQYYYHMTDAEITDEGGVLVDYYVKASDIFGNTKKTDIYHTWVGTGQGTGPGDDRVWMDPDTATGGETATIYYDAVGGPIAGAGQIHIHIGHSGWQGVLSPDPEMTWNATEEAWTYVYSVPLGATAIDVVFNDGAGNWDNNNGSDWHFPVAEGEPGPDTFVIDGELDEGAEVAASTSITLWADWNGTELYVATENPQGTGSDRFIFVAGTPGAMTASPWAKSGQVANWSAYLAEEGEQWLERLVRQRIHHRRYRRNGSRGNDQPLAGNRLRPRKRLDLCWSLCIFRWRRADRSSSGGGGVEQQHRIFRVGRAETATGFIDHHGLRQHR